MSISAFTKAAISEFKAGRPAPAMSLACSAIDGTTAKINSKAKNGDRFKKFLEEHMWTVTHYGFPGIDAGCIMIKCDPNSGLKLDADNYASIADIIYHIIRCSVTHECQIDQRIEFTDQTIIGDFTEKFLMPKKLIIGLLASVIQASENKDELFEHDDIQYILNHAG